MEEYKGKSKFYGMPSKKEVSLIKLMQLKNSSVPSSASFSPYLRGKNLLKFLKHSHVFVKNHITYISMYHRGNFIGVQSISKGGKKKFLIQRDLPPYLVVNSKNQEIRIMKFRRDRVFLLFEGYATACSALLLREKYFNFFEGRQVYFIFCGGVRNVFEASIELRNYGTIVMCGDNDREGYRFLSSQFLCLYPPKEYNDWSDLWQEKY